jgi:hypothetical protein
MDAVWDLLQYLTDTVNSFCPFQILPSPAAQVFEVEQQRYRVLKQVTEAPKEQQIRSGVLLVVLMDGARAPCRLAKEATHLFILRSRFLEDASSTVQHQNPPGQLQSRK